MQISRKLLAISGNGEFSRKFSLYTEPKLSASDNQFQILPLLYVLVGFRLARAFPLHRVPVTIVGSATNTSI